MSIKKIEGDERIRELLRNYKGYNVISIYIEEKADPLLSIDVIDNILNFEELVPLLQYDIEGARGEAGIEAENQSVGVEEGVEGDSEGVRVEEGAEGDNEGVGAGAGAEARNVEEEVVGVEGEE
ncbi:UNVERIFIED_CONTAM: hypothetical protein Sindi_1719500, partial [Sesamum indicum]